MQQFGGEQLAYIAAFATGAALVFGDRPKEATFLRLWGLPSLRDLDAAFGQQSALNYREQLTGRPATSDWSATPGEAEHAVERIMLRERDQVLAHSLRDAALAAGPSGTVIGVIGAWVQSVGYRVILRHRGRRRYARAYVAVCFRFKLNPKSPKPSQCNCATVGSQTMLCMSHGAHTQVLLLSYLAVPAASGACLGSGLWRNGFRVLKLVV